MVKQRLHDPTPVRTQRPDSPERIPRLAWRSPWAIALFALSAGIGLAGDLLTKHAAFAALGSSPEPSRSVIDGFLSLRLSLNPGIVFGIDWLPGWAVLLATVAAMVLMTAVFAASTPGERLLHAACGMVLGGAAGNAFDRLQTGVVRDFIDVRIPVVNYHWPTFNVADVLLVVGLAVIILHLWRRDKAAPGRSGK